jgi:vacuolar protein sorting-associated protein 51
LESLLDSFYGLEDEETAAQNARDIDSSAFDVAASASEVIAKSSLPDLISYANNLESDTKSLDRQMQDLVYNNYSKFIGATDTIQKMKTRSACDFDGWNEWFGLSIHDLFVRRNCSVGEMESRMSTLVKEMRQMGGSSALVNDNLQANRASIEKLVGVKRLLLKLEFLFELPFRLKRSMELDAHGQAVRYYTMVSGVLRKYDSIPSLHKIRVEADALMQGLRAELHAVLRDRSGGGGGSSGRVVESIRLLVQVWECSKVMRAPVHISCQMPEY